MTRVVGHLDLDYFYAQVEEVENPSLMGRPVIVCVYSGRTHDSGVVSTANYRAREFGVKSGIPIVIAKRQLKNVDAVFIPMERAKYEAYSVRIMDLIHSRVDVMEQTGIDEAFFDLTLSTDGDFEIGRMRANSLKREILNSERLTCSVGLAPNKTIAKLASECKKPDGLTIVKADEMQSFLASFRVDSLYSVGVKTAKTLQDNGISTVGSLATARLELLEKLFDRRFAAHLHNIANALDDEPVVERGDTGQISRIVTLKMDSDDFDKIFEQFAPLIDDVHRRVADEKLSFRTISIIGILSNLSAKTRSKTLETPTNDGSILTRVSRELLASLLVSAGPLRRTGIRVSDLSKIANQTSLAEFTEDL